MNIIVYHKDQDGIMSAAIVTKFLKEKHKQYGKKKPKIKYIPAQYNEISAYDIINSYSYAVVDTIWIVDFSFSSEEMKELYSIFGTKLLWYDHHETAMKMSDENGTECIYGARAIVDDQNIKRAACELIYKELFSIHFRKSKIPQIVSLIGSWDTFRWRQEKNQEAYALKLWTDKYADPAKIKNIQIYYDALDNTNDLKIKDGMKLVVDIENSHKKLMESQCIKVKIGEYSGLAVNKVVNSLAFDSVVDYTKDDFVMSFAYVKSGQWKVSIFNEFENELHCGFLCKKIGNGGGHAEAGGFMMNNDDFMKFFSNIIE